MWSKIIALIRSSQILQLLLMLAVGIAIGALCYPTKHIEEKLSKTYEAQITQLKQQHATEVSKQLTLIHTQAKAYNDLKVSTSNKISSLSSQVTELQSKKTKSIYKVVHPDGTIEEREQDETDVDQSSKIVAQVQQEIQQTKDDVTKQLTTTYQNQITSLQATFDSKEQDYKRQIATLTQTKVVDTNPKKFALEAGAISNGNYYLHTTYDVVGPFFLGVQTEFGTLPGVGFGLGLRF